MPLGRFSAVVAVTLGVAIWAPESFAAEVAASDASQFVRKLGDETIAVLATPDATAEQRKARFRELLDEGFAVETIGRFALGRYWRAATPAQRSDYLRLFREFVLETYAGRLGTYAGETLEIIQACPLNQNDTMVSTEIQSPDGPPIRVDYRVRAQPAGLKIIDVFVEGVSLITTQRAEFASVINRTGGVEGLLELLREHTSGEATVN